AFNSTLITSLTLPGHISPLRSVFLSSDSTLCCSLGKGMMKLWDVENRCAVRDVTLNLKRRPGEKGGRVGYGLAGTFVGGGMRAAVGTKEGALAIVDAGSGEVEDIDMEAHKGEVWTVAGTRAERDGEDVEVLATGGKDGEVKIWEVEEDKGRGELVHAKTLKMTDDVVKVGFSYVADKRLLFVSTLDSTVKVFFADTLKFFLSLYGHKLPALGLDCADDDSIMASGGADKTIKVWGLDFGDCHRSLYGHSDSVTDVRFVRGTHCFFSGGKEGNLRYWDADTFQLITVMRGHQGGVNSLAVSPTSGFVVSGGADLTVRVWERTRDVVYLEEEREQEIDRMYDEKEGRRGEVKVGGGGEEEEEGEEDGGGGGGVSSEDAVRKTVMSMEGGDRIVAALDLADAETKNMLELRATNEKRKAKGLDGIEFAKNPLLMGMTPAGYLLWNLRTIRAADLEQAVLVLPMVKVERIMFYFISLLRAGAGVEVVARAAVGLLRQHRRAIVANRAMEGTLKGLRGLLRKRLEQRRDMCGYNLAASRSVARERKERKEERGGFGEVDQEEIWGKIGLGSDVAAALEGKKRRKN
ncbi:hypothetical protein TrRE_jg11567, partial [Triparma retinervis]